MTFFFIKLYMNRGKWRMQSEREKKKLLITTECKTRKELGSVDHIRRSWDIDLKKTNCTMFNKHKSYFEHLQHHSANWFLLFLFNVHTFYRDQKLLNMSLFMLWSKTSFQRQRTAKSTWRNRTPKFCRWQNKTKQLIPLPEKV